MATITRNFRFEEDLIKDLTALAEKEKRSLNNFVATCLQYVVDSSRVSAPPLQLTSEQSRQRQDEMNNSLADKYKIDEFAALQADILKTTYSGDLQKVMKEVEASNVGAVKKAKLRAIADNHRNNFTN